MRAHIMNDADWKPPFSKLVLVTSPTQLSSFRAFTCDVGACRACTDSGYLLKGCPGKLVVPLHPPFSLASIVLLLRLRRHVAVRAQVRTVDVLRLESARSA
ncbi:MAG: hypothetical protein EOO65_02220 [Methanosarcinales archaeon]|nr:MAG: hypothetical protein EOO65_02220 [Methanosarcinales archaeon]